MLDTTTVAYVLLSALWVSHAFGISVDHMNFSIFVYDLVAPLHQPHKTGRAGHG
jgi:hypothetical protein